MRYLLFIMLCIGLMGCATTVPVATQCTNISASVSKDAMKCPNSLKVTKADGSTVCMTPADAATIKAQCPQFQ